MEEIDPTPRRLPRHRSVPSAPLGELAPTPRRFPGLQGGLDPTPRRLPTHCQGQLALPGRPDPGTGEMIATNPDQPLPEREDNSHSVEQGHTISLIDLSSLPELEELAAPLSLVGKETTPLDSQTDATQIESDPLPRTDTPQSALEREKQQRTQTSLARFASLLHQTRALQQTHLRKRRRPHRWLRLIVFLCLLSLLLVGGCSYGIFFCKTNIIGPLGQFFHPLPGEKYSALNGHPWNLLLLGSDNDAKFTYPELLTQVIMVVHIDPLARSLSMVSIPRDSWVHVPGLAGNHKIDQASYLGSVLHKGFDGGVSLALQTIVQDYGIPVDRYAWIGLEGFASLINTIGGIDVDLTHPLLDDNYPDDTGKGTDAHHAYSVKRIYLVPGPQHLTGEETLEYVRSRHADLVGDIGRTQRQQEILQALKHKLDLPTIFNHLSELFKDLAGKVYTDLSQGELLYFASFCRDLSPAAIQRLTLGPGAGQQNYGTLSRIKDPGLGETQDVILPNCANIQPIITTIFDIHNPHSCQVNGP